nr:MAG: DNA pilot protein [Microvirus sp.]
MADLAGIGGIIGGVGSAVQNAGSFITGILNYKEQQKMNEWNIQNVTEQQKYQKYLNEIMMEREDSAVQRRQADLQKAGINPILAGLGGASAQLGHVIQSPVLNAPQLEFGRFGDGLSSVADLVSNIGIKRAQEANLKSQTLVNDANIDLIKAKTGLTEQQILESQQTIDLMESQVYLNKSKLETEKTVQKLNELKSQMTAYQTAELIQLMNQRDIANMWLQEDRPLTKEELEANVDKIKALAMQSTSQTVKNYFDILFRWLEYRKPPQKKKK